MNLLLVEDDIHIQEMVRLATSEIGDSLKLHTTESSSTALQIASEQKIDLFILDIQLTDYKGTQLAKQLREIEHYKYTPMIFATALAGEELMAYRDIKCYHFLIKPFTKEELKMVITEAIAFQNHLAPQKQTIRLKQKSFIVELDVNQIIYMESFGKKVEIHVLSSDGKEQIEEIAGYSLKSLKELIQLSQFIQCHKSFLVNKQYLYKFDKTNSSIQLTVFSREIPVGKKYTENVYT